MTSSNFTPASVLPEPVDLKACTERDDLTFPGGDDEFMKMLFHFIGDDSTDSDTKFDFDSEGAGFPGSVENEGPAQDLVNGAIEEPSTAKKPEFTPNVPLGLSSVGGASTPPFIDEDGLIEIDEIFDTSTPFDFQRLPKHESGHTDLRALEAMFIEPLENASHPAIVPHGVSFATTFRMKQCRCAHMVPSELANLDPLTPGKLHPDETSPSSKKSTGSPPFEVRMSKGWGVFHAGTRIYRRLVAVHRARYQQANGFHKRIIAHEIVEEIHSCDGVFVELVNGARVEITDGKRLVQKVMAALRGGQRWTRS